jgi:hypothetical protein
LLIAASANCWATVVLVILSASLLRFYPHFSTFLTHVTSRAASFPRHLPRAPSMCLQITGFIFAYVALTCIILCAHVLIWFFTAVPRLLIMFLWLIRLWLTSPLLYYTPSPFVRSLIPVYVITFHLH